MRGSQRAIAKALNISVATVNRALKNNPATSAVTRARVAEVAMRVGYRTQPAGRLAKEASARAQTLVPIGVFCRGQLSSSSIHNAVDLRVFRGMTMSARRLRASLHVEYLAPNEFDHLDNPAVWPPALREQFVSGAVLLGGMNPAAADRIAEAMPCVQFGWPRRHLQADAVSEDHIGAMSQLVDFLRAQGHEKIGLADFGYDSPSASLRVAGYIRELALRDLPFDPRDTHCPAAHGHESIARAEHVAAHVQDRMSDGVRAWICMDDYQGYLLLDALRSRGIEAPRDLSVCGFDNFDPPAGLPKLTTIDGPFEAAGDAALTRCMKRLLNRDGAPVHILLGCKLIEGQSTGPPCLRR